MYFTRFMLAGNYASLIYQINMASKYPMAGCKKSIMEYCSKFLVSSICQNIFITYIKNLPL